MKQRFGKSRFVYVLLPVGVLLLAFWWRVLIFDYGLPYVHNVDEPNMYVMANDLRGAKEATWRSLWLEGYPPGYIRFEATLLNLLDSAYNLDIYQDMGMYMVFLRYLSLLFDMITLSLLMLITRLIGSRGASALAGIIWALAAPIAYNAITALPDPPMLMFCALCAFFTLMAFRKQSLFYGFAATFAGIMIMVFKYPAAPALIMPGLFFLYWLYTRRLRALIPAALAAVFVGGAVYLLLFSGNAGELGIREANAARGDFIGNIFSVDRWLHTMDSFTDSISPVLFVVGILAFFIWMFRQRFRQSPATLLLFVTGILVLIPVPGYIAADYLYPLRYTWPASLFFIAAGTLLVYQVFIQPLSLPRRKGVLLAFTGIVTLSLLPQSLAQLAEFRRPYTYYEAQRWFDENLPETDNVILASQQMPYRALLRDEGGYSGFKQFATFLATDREWQKIDLAKMNYIFMRDVDVETWADAYPDWTPLDDLILLKQFDTSARSGDALSIYVNKTMPDTNPIIFTDGSTQIKLRGLQAEKDNNTLLLEGYWQAAVPDIHEHYTLAMHLTPADEMNTVLAQQDYAPGRRPTYTWDDPDEILEATFQPFVLPEDLPPGDYALRLILYEWQTGRRMSPGDGQDRLTVLAFSVDQ